MTTQRGHRQLPTDGDPRRIPPLPVGHPADLAHCPTTAHHDDQAEADPPLAQHGLSQPRGPGSTLGRRRAVVDTAGDHADPGHPAVRLPAHRHAPRPHSRRTPRTPEAGGWTPGRPDARTGHRSLGQAPRDSGRSHRTPDAAGERGHGDDSTAGVRTSLAATPSDRTLGRQPCLRSPTTSRLRGRSAGQAAPRRTAVLGRLRVEGRAGGSRSSVMASAWLRGRWSRASAKCRTVWSWACDAQEGQDSGGARAL
jgi:hypothetical protein